MPKLDRLQPVELRDIWSDEATDFTPWLAEEDNLALLSETLRLVERYGILITTLLQRKTTLCLN